MVHPIGTLVVLLLICLAVPAMAAGAVSENVVLVAIDGVRPQEAFFGADKELLEGKAGGVKSFTVMRDRYWRQTPEARREALMPFLWSVLARRGQVFGYAQQNSRARNLNGRLASPFCYGEMLCGFCDQQVVGRPDADKPKLNVLEWLNGRPGFAGRVSAYATWGDMLPVLNMPQSKLRAFGGWQKIADEPLTPREKALNELMDDLPRIWPAANFDFVVMQAAMEHLQKHKPRVFFIALNDADEWGHLRRYDLYLDSIQRSDRFIQRLWQTLQQMPEYADKTTLIVVTDHGRGNTAETWINHAASSPGADAIWMAVLGPGTPALGVRQSRDVTQGQVAASVAALLGEDFPAGDSRRSPPLPEVLAPAKAEAARRLDEPIISR